jgi:serine/threonine protein kinase
MMTYSCPVAPLEITELKFSSVEVYTDQAIGKGSTYRAKCDQLPCTAKVLQITTGATEEEMIGVCISCQCLSAIRHPNIVQCLGTARWGFKNHPIILMEELQENLGQYLERYSKKPSGVPYHVKVSILCDVAFGVDYLHHIGIIHGHLTASNVLIVGESRAKITDFWMFNISTMHPVMQHREIDSSKTVYMAPESLTQPPTFTPQSDTYSLGIITVFTDTQDVPEAEGPRTSKMKPMSPFIDIAKACVKRDPLERHRLENLCQHLVSLKRGERFVADREASRSETEHLRSELLVHKRELLQYKETLERKEKDMLEMSMSIANLDRKVLDAVRMNKELAKVNVEHEVFERYLQSTASPFRQPPPPPPQDFTDAPDSTVLSPSDAERVCSCMHALASSPGLPLLWEK